MLPRIFFFSVLLGLSPTTSEVGEKAVMQMQIGPGSSTTNEFGIWKRFFVQLSAGIT
jgi:hypothetical protein